MEKALFDDLLKPERSQSHHERKGQGLAPLRTRTARHQVRQIEKLKFPMTTKIIIAKPKSDAFAAIHSAAQGLNRAGIISKTKMREYDVLCLNKREMK